MFSWFYRDVDVSWHTTGGLRLCVARPRAPRDDLTVALWFSGGGLFRINPWLLSYCVRAYAARGHVIVAPIYATSRPRIFVWLQTAVVCAAAATAASYLPPEAASPSLKWVAVAAVSFCFAVFRLARPSAAHPEHLRDAALAVRWAVDHAETYGAARRLVLAGHSGGGWLACMLALEPRWLEEVGLRFDDAVGGLWLLSPVLDWTWVRAAPAPVRFVVSELWLSSQFLGTDELSDVSPLALLRGGAAHPDVPVLLVRAGSEFGPLVRASAERTICLPEYAEALRASGVRAVYEARAKGRHVSALFYVGGWWEGDGDAAREFWRRARAPSSAV